MSLPGPSSSSYRLERASMQRARPTLLRPRLRQRHPWWCRNINLLSITYASRPRLRIRLTHGRIILPQETLGLRREGFSPSLSRTRARILSSRTSSRPCRSTFIGNWSAPLPPARSCVQTRSFGAWLKPRVIFGAPPLAQ